MYEKSRRTCIAERDYKQRSNGQGTSIKHRVWIKRGQNYRETIKPAPPSETLLESGQIALCRELATNGRWRHRLT